MRATETPETVLQLRQRAVRLLARRDHTRLELTRKLAGHGADEDVAAVVDELAARGLQSDARFAQAYVDAQGARLGAARLRQTLRQKGVADELARDALGTDTLADEASRARAVWAKKFRTAPADAREWARQARFLQSRGFAADLIRKLLREPGEGA